MKIPSVSLKTWNHLYEAADRVYDLKPWEFVDDTELFGIQDPVSGEVGYCCILGGATSLIGIAIYRGNQGLKVYEKIRSGELNTETEDFLLYQNCLQVLYVKMSDLDREDLKVIKRITKKPQEKEKAPIFRSYSPLWAPWFLSESEAQFLTLCLERVIEFTEIYQTDLGILDAEKPGTYLTYVSSEKNNDLTWSLKWKSPQSSSIFNTSTSPLEDSIPARFNLSLVEKIQSLKLKRYGDWEADLLSVTGLMNHEGEDRPYFPRIITLIERENLEAIFTQVIAPLDSSEETLLYGILKTIQQRKGLPERICVSRAKLLIALQPLCNALGIELRIRSQLPVLSLIKEELRAFAGENRKQLHLDQPSELSSMKLQ